MSLFDHTGPLVSSGGLLRNAYEVMREKECAIERILREIEALRLVSHLLTDEADLRSSHLGSGVRLEGQVGRVSQQAKELEYNGPRLVAEKEASLDKIRACLLEAEREEIKKRRARNILIQFRYVVIRFRRVVIHFRHVVMGASHSVLSRVLHNHSWEHELRPEVQRGTKNEIKKWRARKTLLQFRHVAMRTSRRALSRVLRSRVWGHGLRPNLSWDRWKQKVLSRRLPKGSIT